MRSSPTELTARRTTAERIYLESTSYFSPNTNSTRNPNHASLNPPPSCRRPRRPPLRSTTVLPRLILILRRHRHRRPDPALHPPRRATRHTLLRRVMARSSQDPDRLPLHTAEGGLSHAHLASECRGGDRCCVCGYVEEGLEAEFDVEGCVDRTFLS